MPGMPGARHASPVEIWAARAWNVFNEGRPFSIVYPLLVLLAAAAVGLGPDGPVALALLTAAVVAAGSAPPLLKAVRTSGIFSARAMLSCRRDTISGGVRAGAETPNQLLTS